MISRLFVCGATITALCLALASPGRAAVLFEQRVDSLAGQPQAAEFSFDASGYEDLSLVVTNGAPGGGQRVSSAIVAINGVKVLVPADFNQNVAELRRALPQGDGPRSVSVTLKSNPGSYLLVQVHGELSLNLPPDPGANGNATISGVDVNQNGVRDDVERWIGLNNRGSEKKRLALTQTYYPVQSMLASGLNGNSEQALNDMTALQRANECLGYIMGSSSIYDTQMALRAQILNTAARSSAYQKAGKLLGGGSFPKKPRSQWKNSCSFNPDAIAN